MVCQGTLIHYNLILTSARCIPEYTSLEDYEVRVGDWDVLTDYNEYEAYTNSKFRICSRRALSSYSEGDSYYSGYSRPGYGYNQRVSKYYGKDSSDLILVKSDFESTLKFPQVRPICLPKSYSSPNYYDQGQDQYSTYAVCWVAGWYGSDKIQLRNVSNFTVIKVHTCKYYVPCHYIFLKHPSAEKVKEYGYGGYYSDGYGSSSNYYQKYYKGYDSSMIQKRAKVKQVDCPSSYGNSYSYGYSSTEVCFVGIDGYDACVAEQGAAVFCVIKENENYGGYDSGYNNPAYGVNVGPAYESVDASYEFPVMSSLHPEYNAQNSYYSKPEIKANPSPSKPNRYRAILYAVVQKPSKCGKSYDSYGYGYSRKSRPLVATRVDYETVSGIMDLFWSHGYDKACPVTKSYYKEPKSNYGYGSNKSYKSFYYFGTYAPLNRYGYGRRPMSFSIYY